MSVFKCLLYVMFVSFLGIFFMNGCVARDSEDKNKDKTVSIIIPVYNVEEYLRECLDSVIKQTHEKLQIICINDASTDGSKGILDEYQKKDDRIELIDLSKNRGVSLARNIGLCVATGDYVAFVDPDDVLELNAYETALSKIEGDVDILVWGYNAFPNASGWWIRSGKSMNAVYEGKSVDAFFDSGSLRTVVWNKLYRNATLKDSGIRFNENLKMAEDVDFNMLFFVRSNKIQFIEDKLYDYRVGRKGSLTDIYVEEKRANNHKILFKHVLDDWDKFGILKGNEEKVLDWFTRMSYNVIISIQDSSFRQRYANDILNLFWQHMSEGVKDKLDSDTKGKLEYIQKCIVCAA